MSFRFVSIGQEQREKGAEAAVKEALEDVGLLHTINMMPSELSGGMKKSCIGKSTDIKAESPL